MHPTFPLSSATSRLENEHGDERPVTLVVVHLNSVLNREIIPSDVIVRSKTIDGTGELNLALLDHVGALRDQAREMHVLLRQQHRNAGRSYANYCLRDLLDDFWREAFGGLVQKNERGISHECARYG